jgi:hypothetical protein
MRKVRYTGFPPPAEQLAHQLRTGTGFTWAKPGPDGPKLQALGFTLQGYSRPAPRAPWRYVNPPNVR